MLLSCHDWWKFRLPVQKTERQWDILGELRMRALGPPPRRVVVTWASINAEQHRDEAGEQLPPAGPARKDA